MSAVTAVESKKTSRRLSVSGFFSGQWGKTKGERKMAVVTRIEPKEVIIEEAAVISYDVCDSSPKVERAHVVKDNVIAIGKFPIPKEEVARNAVNREIRSKGKKVARKKPGDVSSRSGLFDSFRSNKKPPKYALNKSKDQKSPGPDKGKQKNKSPAKSDNATDSKFGSCPVSPLSELARARNLQIFDDDSPKIGRRSDNFSIDGSPKLCRQVSSSSHASDDSDVSPFRRVHDLSSIQFVADNRRLPNLKNERRSPVSDDDGISSGSNTPISVLVTPCSNSDSDSCLHNDCPTTSDSNPNSPEDDLSEGPFYSPSIVANATLPRNKKSAVKPLKTEDKKRSKSQESLLTTIFNAVTRRGGSSSGEDSPSLLKSSFMSISNASMQSADDGPLEQAPDFDDDNTTPVPDRTEDEVFVAEFTTWEGREAATLPRPKHKQVIISGMGKFILSAGWRARVKR